LFHYLTDCSSENYNDSVLVDPLIETKPINCPKECFEIIKFCTNKSHDERIHFCNKTSAWKETIDNKTDVLSLFDTFDKFSLKDSNLFSYSFKNIIFYFFLSLKNKKLKIPKPVLFIILSFL
jgi:hypothetical protein